MTTRRRRNGVRIRTRNDIGTTQATPQKPKPEPPPKPKPTRTGAPRPVEEALDADDLVRVDDILRNAVLTPREVGTLLRVSPTTVLKLVQDGDLPAMRLHRQTRVLRIDVLTFIRDLRDRENRLRQYDESQQQEKKAKARTR